MLGQHVKIQCCNESDNDKDSGNYCKNQVLCLILKERQFALLREYRKTNFLLAHHELLIVCHWNFHDWQVKYQVFHWVSTMYNFKKLFIGVISVGAIGKNLELWWWSIIFQFLLGEGILLTPLKIWTLIQIVCLRVKVSLLAFYYYVLT